MTTKPSATAKADLTPTGKLRVGINHSNFLLSQHDASGKYRGVAIDIAAEIARRLGTAVEIVGFENPGLMAEAAQKNSWDIAFMGSEPARASVIAFSAAYLEIDASYLVPAGTTIKSIDEVDRAGVRIALMSKSAYDLYLSRNLKHATLVRVPSMDASLEIFLKDKLEVLAGLKPRLLSDLEKVPGSKLLEGRFTAVQQSIGTPQGRPAAAEFLRQFVEEIKVNGMVGELFVKHSVRGASVAPLARHVNK